MTNAKHPLTILHTPREIIHALGGPAAVLALLPRVKDVKIIFNWYQAGIPSRYYVAVQAALAPLGYQANPAAVNQDIPWKERVASGEPVEAVPAYVPAWIPSATAGATA